MNNLQNSYVYQALTPQALASTSELLGTAIDASKLGSFSDLVFFVSTSSTVGTLTVVVKESATTGGSYATITGTSLTMVPSTAGTSMISVRLGGARLGFFKISITSDDATSRSLSAIALGVNPTQGVLGSTEALRATNAGLLKRTVV